MSIIRLIHIKVDPSETANAVRIWKTQCASLMIQQKGCLSEKLLRCRDAPEFISYSEWKSEAAIEAYRQQRRPQGDRAAHARTERGEGGGQALRPGAIGPKRERTRRKPSPRFRPGGIGVSPEYPSSSSFDRSGGERLLIAQNFAWALLLRKTQQTRAR